MPAFRRSRDDARGRPDQASRGGQSAAARAVAGFLLGVAAGAVAALVTPRPGEPAGPAGPADPEALPAP